jgi:hypothetical protein
MICTQPALILQVRGLTKKGREFFRLNTTLTAPPDALCVADGHVWAAVGSLLCHYTEAGQQDSYMAPDAITAIEARACSSLGTLPVGQGQGVRA